MQWSKCLYCNNRIEPWLRISSQANFGLFQRNPWQPLAEPWGSAEPPLKNTGLRTSGLSKRHAASANNRPALLVELETKFCKVRNTVYKTCCTVTTYFSINQAPFHQQTGLYFANKNDAYRAALTAKVTSTIVLITLQTWSLRGVVSSSTCLSVVGLLRLDSNSVKTAASIQEWGCGQIDKKLQKMSLQRWDHRMRRRRKNSPVKTTFFLPEKTLLRQISAHFIITKISDIYGSCRQRYMTVMGI